MAERGWQTENDREGRAPSLILSFENLLFVVIVIAAATAVPPPLEVIFLYSATILPCHHSAICHSGIPCFIQYIIS